MPPKNLQELLSQINIYLHNKYIWDASRPDSIPALFGNHVSIVGLTMLFAVIIAFPVSLLIARFERLYLPVITIAGIAYTIPSIVLLALLVPITGIGSQTTIVVTLVVFAQIILIRNFVAAIRSVDPTLQEVGRAMGMSEGQLLLRVTLPLAMPIIIAGLRLATVTTIGIATIGPLAGVDDLGSIIFKGFQPYYPAQLIVGAGIITLLAVTADLALLGVQRLLSRGRPIAVAL